MTRSTTRRTSGIAKYIVGEAIAQEIIQDSIQRPNMPTASPSTRYVDTPETRKLMISEVPSERAKRL